MHESFSQISGGVSIRTWMLWPEMRSILAVTSLDVDGFDVPVNIPWRFVAVFSASRHCIQLKLSHVALIVSFFLLINQNFADKTRWPYTSNFEIYRKTAIESDTIPSMKTSSQTETILQSKKKQSAPALDFTKSKWNTHPFICSPQSLKVVNTFKPRTQTTSQLNVFRDTQPCERVNPLC